MAKNELKIIAKSRYWTCENMDLLAPINEQGNIYLLSNNETICIADREIAPKLEYANQEEILEFARQYRHYVFAGDKVNIIKGKMKGESKVVAKYFKYVVPNTYGHAFTNYLVFADGTKTDIFNCVHLNGKEIWHYKEPKDLVLLEGGRL